MAFRGTADNLILLKEKTLVKDVREKLAKFGTQINKDSILHCLNLLLKPR